MKGYKATPPLFSVEVSTHEYNAIDVAREVTFKEGERECVCDTETSGDRRQRRESRKWPNSAWPRLADEGVIVELEKPSLCGADVRRRIAGAN